LASQDEGQGDVDDGSGTVEMKNGVLHKLGLGTLFRPWATRYFSLRRSADPASHAAPLLTYYTRQSRTKIKEVPITAGMRVKLLRGAGGGWDSARTGDPQGVGILISYGYKRSGRTEMLLVADTLREAKEWTDVLTEAIEYNDRHLKLESSTSLGNSLASAEYRKSIASCMGLLTDEEDVNGTDNTPNSSSPKEPGTNLQVWGSGAKIASYIFVFIVPLLPLLVPSCIQVALWISLCYLCLCYIIFTKYDLESTLLSLFNGFRNNSGCINSDRKDK
jgi:hypothetical protein